MTAQRSSQFVNFLKIAPLHFLSLILLISQRRNGARGRAALGPLLRFIYLICGWVIAVGQVYLWLLTVVSGFILIDTSL
jgi:hypothetical protein